MEIIDEIPVEFDNEQIIRTLKVRRMNQQEIASLVNECRPLIKPKAVYAYEKVATIEKEMVSLQSGHTFKSVILADTLRKDQTIAVYVITIGLKLEEKASEKAKTSMIQSWIIESIGDYALRKAFQSFQLMIKDKLGSRLSSFGPGTGTGKLFGIDQPQVLFKILDPPKKIGVNLTPSYLMLPRKSISGVLAETNREYVACQYCPREKCQNRRKPFSGEYTSIDCGMRHSRNSIVIATQKPLFLSL